MRFKLLSGVLISVVLLFLVFREINFNLSAIWVVCRGVKYPYLILTIGATLFSFLIRAWRWGYLLAPVRPVRFRSLLSATMIGFMANNLLPARLGELVRAYVIGKIAAIDKRASFGTIVIERIFDGFTLVSFLVMVLVTSAALPDMVIQAGYVVLGLYLLVLVFLFFLELRPRYTRRLLERAFTPFPVRWRGAIMKGVDGFVQGLRILRNGRQLLIVLLISLIHWLVLALAVYTTFLAFSFALPLAAAMVVLAVLGLGVMVPSSPGFIGTFQASCVLALALFSISRSEALGFSLIFHATQFFPVTLVGLAFLWTDHLSFQEIRQADIN